MLKMFKSAVTPRRGVVEHALLLLFMIEVWNLVVQSNFVTVAAKLCSVKYLKHAGKKWFSFLKIEIKQKEENCKFHAYPKHYVTLMAKGVTQAKAYVGTIFSRGGGGWKLKKNKNRPLLSKKNQLYEIF